MISFPYCWNLIETPFPGAFGIWFINCVVSPDCWVSFGKQSHSPHISTHWSCCPGMFIPLDDQFWRPSQFGSNKAHVGQSSKMTLFWSHVSPRNQKETMNACSFKLYFPTWFLEWGQMANTKRTIRLQTACGYHVQYAYLCFQGVSIQGKLHHSPSCLHVWAWTRSLVHAPRD